jgi:hypothetical protein
VALYSAVFGLQALAWVLMMRVALSSSNRLITNEHSIQTGRENLKKGYYATVLYMVFAFAAFWFPLIIALFVAFSWIVWLIIGINMKEK